MSSASRPIPSRRFAAELAEFGAPVGRRVRFIGFLCYGLIGLFVVFDVVLALTIKAPPRQLWAMALAPLIGLAVIFPVAIFSQVRSYRVTADELVVVRRNRQNRFPLAGLQSVEADRAAMERSSKIFGNDGLGAITGRFRNSKLGAYEALATDGDRAVVLRWPDRCLVVSPERPEDFVAELRARAGLRR